MSSPASARLAPSAADLTRAEVEDFLYEEAALLDEWKLAEWHALFTEDATYRVPSTDVPEAEPGNTLFLIDDDAARLRSRVEQLLGKSTWSENPHSRTRRLLANVRIRRTEGARAWVTANFAVYRMRTNQTACYIGRYEYVLERRSSGLRIESRRAILDLESLRDVGKISFIL
jgi:Small subunit of phenylpropionate dioxygenase